MAECIYSDFTIHKAAERVLCISSSSPLSLFTLALVRSFTEISNSTCHKNSDEGWIDFLFREMNQLTESPTNTKSSIREVAGICIWRQEQKLTKRDLVEQDFFWQW